MEGRRILQVEQRRGDLRFPLPPRFAERLAGATVKTLSRRAKFLLADLSSGETLIMHLGMSGRFTVAGALKGRFHHATGGLAAHDHVVFHLESGETVTYNDPRRFGFMELQPTGEVDSCPRLASLGPEPLSNHFSPAYLDAAMAAKSAPVKAVLLDQRVIAGLGNIYACEALWRACISPRRQGRSVRGARAARLASAIKAVIAEAIAAGGSSISDFAGAAGEPGYFQHRFDVYDREGEACRRCDKPVQRIVQSGRSTFYCGGCQR